MLKFTEFNEENIEGVARMLFGSDDYALEVLNSFDFSDEDVYYAAAYSHGCILIRIFDFGRYMFLYPIDMTEDSDSHAAVAEIAEYAMREEIGLCFADVPNECVSYFLELGFLHLEIDAEGEESCRVRIKTECELAPANLMIEHENVSLTEFFSSDTQKYAELCRDEAVNEFWGYDYKLDVPDANDNYFFENIKEGRIYGTSMSLAIRAGGKFVGEVQLFAFDGRGACEFAVRIARECQGRGYGKLAIEALIKLAEKIGIRKLSCDVLNENIKSQALMKKYLLHTESKDPERQHFELKL